MRFADGIEGGDFVRGKPGTEHHEALTVIGSGRLVVEMVAGGGPRRDFRSTKPLYRDGMALYPEVGWWVGNNSLVYRRLGHYDVK